MSSDTLGRSGEVIKYRLAVWDVLTPGVSYSGNITVHTPGAVAHVWKKHGGSFWNGCENEYVPTEYWLVEMMADLPRDPPLKPIQQARIVEAISVGRDRKAVAALVVRCQEMNEAAANG